MTIDIFTLKVYCLCQSLFFQIFLLALSLIKAFFWCSAKVKQVEILTADRFRFSEPFCQHQKIWSLQELSCNTYPSNEIIIDVLQSVSSQQTFAIKLNSANTVKLETNKNPEKNLQYCNNATDTYLFKFNNGNNGTNWEIYSKFTVKTPEWHTDVVLVSLSLTLNLFHFL